MIQVKYEMLCQVRVDRQPVTLAAKAYGLFTHSYEFWGLSESVMASLDGCVGLLGDTKLLQLCNGGNCRMFISSVDMNGNLGGLRGADATCQARATTARLPGTYKAWLSGSNDSPSTRFTQSTRPYVRVDGQVVANNWDELTIGAGKFSSHLFLGARFYYITGVISGRRQIRDTWNTVGPDAVYGNGSFANGKRRLDPLFLEILHGVISARSAIQRANART